MLVNDIHEINVRAATGLYTVECACALLVVSCGGGGVVSKNEESI